MSGTLVREGYLSSVGFLTFFVLGGGGGNLPCDAKFRQSGLARTIITMLNKTNFPV